LGGEYDETTNMLTQPPQVN
jgi:hypothetical protein